MNFVTAGLIVRLPIVNSVLHKRRAVTKIEDFACSKDLFPQSRQDQLTAEYGG
jgi:hypothetical protein